MSRGNLISVLVLGTNEKFTSKFINQYEETSFDFHYEFKKQDINDYDVILTVGKNWGLFPDICKLEYNIRKKWIHTESINENIGERVLTCYFEQLRYKNFTPLVSVFTPTYKTGDKIYRPFNSLKKQTYDNWEWVVFDDSPDNETFEKISDFNKEEHRISLYKSNKNSGNIGEVKHRCCALAKGDILVELDHDDELTPNALELIVKGFGTYPECGFAYTDWVELFDDKKPAIYNSGFGYGYGSYRKEVVEGYGELHVCQAMNINPKTVRHLVGLPNHIRAWKRDVYNEIGGYSRNCIIADDFELLINTFLKTKMLKIPQLGYIQYYQKSGIKNTQDYRRKEIQRHVRYIRNKYEEQIHARFKEFGIDDYIYEYGIANFNKPNPTIEQFANAIF